MSDADGPVRATRRHFLAGVGGAAATSWLALHWSDIAAAHDHAAATRSADVPAFTVLDAAGARDVEAIAAQIVPTDDLPGAREAGAVYFVDRSLHTWFAADANDFLAGLRDFQARYAAAHGGAFAAADEATQVAFLRDVEETAFFGSMRLLTLLGLCALPAYGGNRDGIGWRLLGFEDRHAFHPPFGHYDRDYPGFAAAGAKT